MCPYICLVGVFTLRPIWVQYMLHSVTMINQLPEASLWKSTAKSPMQCQSDAARSAHKLLAKEITEPWAHSPNEFSSRPPVASIHCRNESNYA